MTKTSNAASVLQQAMSADNYRKLTELNNPALCDFVADAVTLCQPADVFVCSDSSEDVAHVRSQAAATGEEAPLAIQGHTVHFDGMQDQGRDREVTKYLVPKGETLSSALNQIDREEGLAEVRGLMAGAMKGRTLIVRLLSLGPAGSPFSVLCAQCTDSWYVAHSEDLLYRRAYEAFRSLGDKARFFSFLHSSGKVDQNMVSAEPDKKRIYMDHTRETIYSVNTQYAGNTVGLKKLALRLTIRKADREGWLAEHMFLMGVHGPGGRKTYFAGAFPSACGKTSTAMLPGETIMGDDIAYFREIDGQFRAVNAEAGIFGIIGDVNPAGDPAIFSVLSNPGEVIFSNVLIKDKKPYWPGMGQELPEEGVNYSGPWQKGKKDDQGKPIPPAHKNARYTVTLSAMENVDSELNNPGGVEVGAIVYGGRDAHAWIPVQQSFSWEHGIIAYGASLETETTFAIIGQEGVNEINLMSIQDFVSIPLGRYVRNNIEFAKKIRKPPILFAVNYFLRDAEGKFLNGVRDKAVWIKWMELRVHGDVDALRGPTGLLPRYEDLQRLFSEVLNKNYSKEDYLKQFSIRVPQNLSKLQRVEQFHRTQVDDAPAAIFEVLAQQRDRLLEAQKTYGDLVSPLDLSVAE
ncbi:MAG: Phosphoenolpyruvate carboxykinase (GTP) [Planctomycetes bacterium ADurb.Bin126]|nr:MAG: Phosphoenolpyruvate carboxykinase (GTP) [Planctomycetes bacterium ADurb.Bin126]HOD81850.1 phosphoenolpyruvate carboxykinase (GTP) [Phycisphaerae bacterium]HQL75717.1 phosphoenolpyruvate carboxykinase (GTP) [Phycisphaerae bacterium]